jgi:predicted metalloprotease
MKWKKWGKSRNVEDRRMSSGGGRGFRLPSLQTLFFIYPLIKPLLRSKFGLMILGVGALAYFSGFNPLSLIGMGGHSSSTPATKSEKLQDDERAALASSVLSSTEQVWGDIFRQAGYRYTPAKMVLYRGSTHSGCGGASAQMGPFYCPNDQKVYVDLNFFDELKYKFGAHGGDFAEAYVLAHEIGHHIQNLQGTLDAVQRKKMGFGKYDNALQVRVELQADCYAGVWAHHAQEQMPFLEEGDIDEALDAANKIGDDTLQKETQGYVVPDSFTHGSSKQRMTWFLRGLKSGDLRSCNTFN